jgi:hypothetical protein
MGLKLLVYGVFYKGRVAQIISVFKKIVPKGAAIW